jgi:hypothetical protein
MQEAGPTKVAALSFDRIGSISTLVYGARENLTQTAASLSSVYA